MIIFKVGEDGNGYVKALLAKPHREHTLWGSRELAFF
jgi:hypothetical protein